MSIDPRVALETLVAALEEHLAASASRRSEQDPSVEAAYVEIANAFEAYEDALYDAYGEVTPLEVYEDDEADDDSDADSDADPDEDTDEDLDEADGSDDDADPALELSQDRRRG